MSSLNFLEDKFDSEHLRKKVVRIYLPQSFSYDSFESSKNEADAEMIVCFASYNPETIKLLQKANFNYITSRNVYLKNLSNVKIGSFNLKDFQVKITSNLKSEHINDLSKLAIQLASHSRYAKDSNIGYSLAKKLYAQWVRNSLQLHFADESISLWKNNCSAALFTLKERENSGYIDLIVVDSKYKGLGCGKILIQKSIEYFKNKGINQLFINTEAENIQANGFYQTMGFKLFDYKLIFHWHKS